LIREQSRLVARGVRLLALVGQCSADPVTMLEVATRLETITNENVVPFVLDERNGTAEYGYAATEWVLDLFRWAMTEDLPSLQRNRIVGLLCGYGAEAIRLFEERQAGRLFQSPNESASPESN